MLLLEESAGQDAKKPYNTEARTYRVFLWQNFCGYYLFMVKTVSLHMKTVIHKAETRGHANHGWLDSYHTFSFAGYYDEERMHFGALRVLNDDKVAPGMGFGTHPHKNMEIISIPLSGDLEHQDSMGNKHVISEGDVQVMSAGTGISHSEYNRNKDKEVKFLQIWVFPKQSNVQPKYDQKKFSKEDRQNRLQAVVAPDGAGNGALNINQDAWFHLSSLSSGKELSYTMKGDDTGVYIFVLSGNVLVAGEKLSTRDGIGIWDTDEFSVQAASDAELLFMEVPMQ